MSKEKKVTVIKPEKKNDRLRIAAYTRVSSDSYDQLHSFQTQTEFYRHYISSMKNAVLVDVYTDEGITGTRMDKRLGFQRMIKDCENGKIDRIITKSINRFARNIVETLRVLRELKALGVSVYFELENIDTAQSGSEVMLSIYSLMAENESKTIANNLRWAFRNRAKEGIYNQSKLPYGYVRDINNIIVIVEREAVIVEMIFDMYVYLDISVEKIKEYFNEYNVGDRRWILNGIVTILKNERYCGDMLLQKKYTTDEFPFRLVRNNGELPQYYVYDVFPAIISRETYRKSIEKLAKAKEKYNKNQNGEQKIYPFTRKITCGYCGAKFKRRKMRKTPYWACKRHVKKAGDCPIKAVSEEELKEGFISVYHKLKDNIFMLEEYMDNVKDIAMNRDIQDELMDIDLQLTQLLKDKENLYHYYTENMIDFATFSQKMNDININKSLLELEKTKRNEELTRHLEVMETQSIITTLQGSHMHEFDEIIFKRLVDSMEVDDIYITYNLRNEIKVRIERSNINSYVN